ncbi:MAG: DUF1194 domain-containing protein [Proteobacteria bacterium]|nr:DUF1194 domain-containing protein [Pseudomonadota bacterium]MBI3497071.1 DUF1194 domain-containing protein [Pseudomonadota bacterium]
MITARSRRRRGWHLRIMPVPAPAFLAAAWLVLIALAGLDAGPAQAASPDPVDLALVLAVDVSDSIDDGEFRLQRQGYAAAFEDPRVTDAIALGAHGRIVVTLMHWASASEQRQVLGWTQIADREGARAFAALVATAPRTAFPGGSTSLSGAITGALWLFETGGYKGARRVIDISGDGINNNGRPPEFARDEAITAGVTVNGLAILSDDLLLERYFEARVMGGPGAFVVTVDSSAAIAGTLVVKLVREIAGLSLPLPEAQLAGAFPLAGSGQAR